MGQIVIVEEGPERLPDYGSISIAFQTTASLSLHGLAAGDFRELTIPHLAKDYDSLGEDPATLADRFDLTNWGILAAYEEGERVGGAILAWNTPGVDMLDNRDDLAAMWDLRVRPESRGKGVATSLFLAAIEWAKRHGCIELRVETQDNNVGACRFYFAMGCRVHTINPHAYGPPVEDEAQIIWTLTLT